MENGIVVVAWILGGNALGLLLLNAMFSKGTSPMSEVKSVPLDKRVPPAATAR